MTFYVPNTAKLHFAMPSEIAILTEAYLDTTIICKPKDKHLNWLNLRGKEDE